LGDRHFRKTIDVFFLITILQRALSGLLPAVPRCSIYLQFMQLYVKKSLQSEENMEYGRLSRQWQ